MHTLEYLRNKLIVTAITSDTPFCRGRFTYIQDIFHDLVIIREFQYIARDFWEEITGRYAYFHLQSHTTNNHEQILLAGSHSLYLSDIETNTNQKIQLHGN